MTSKIKCPFCAYELQKNGLKNLCCPICGLVAPTKLWQALIQAKQDLENAKADIEDYKKHKALWEEIRNNTILELERKLEIATKALDKADRFFEGTIGLYQSEMMAIIKTALEQINHFADVSNMVEHKEDK